MRETRYRIVFKSLAMGLLVACIACQQSQAGIVSRFLSITTPDSDIATANTQVIDGFGLNPAPDDFSRDTDSPHFEIDIDNSWNFEYANIVPSGLPPLNDPSSLIDIYLEPQLAASGKVWIDSFFLWNQNKGDALHFPDPDNSNNWGITGVAEAELYYTSNTDIQFNGLGAVAETNWRLLRTILPNQSKSEQSSSQQFNFDATEVRFLRFRLVSPFGYTYNSDGVPVKRIGFAELAYREVPPPAPPVVPEPGSIAVFGGLMAAGGWMRWRRRRSVGG